MTEHAGAGPGAEWWSSEIPEDAVDATLRAVDRMLGASGADPGPRVREPLPARGDEVDVTHVPGAADWLLRELGRGRLSGVFRRGPGFVFTPLVGQEGYLPLTEDAANDDGPAQVRALDAGALAARVRHRYTVVRGVSDRKGGVKLDEFGNPVMKPAMFPLEAAKDVLAAPEDVPGLRALRGVVHTPTFRADGSLIDSPGYDAASGLLYLPEPGLEIPEIPERPSDAQIEAAAGAVGEMVKGFSFASEHDHANYLGLLLTPLLRSMAPAPYKLAAFEAHQPGSGKTLLASTIRWVHGGVFRVELPAKDEELAKQVTSILNATTGSVVLFDNVTGSLKSSVLAGLLTSDRWDDRKLGSSEMLCASNDRLWMVTGNNLHIGGDMARRTLRVGLDPGVPHPELRTGFAIPDLCAWVQERRGALLGALLTLVRAWVCAGAPLAPETSSDGYSRWIRTVRGILSTAKVDGVFDHESTRVATGADDDDWGVFLEAAREVFGDAPWTCRQLLERVGEGHGLVSPEALPSGLVKGRSDLVFDYTSLAKSLGRFCENRKLRWSGGVCVVPRGEDRKRSRMWSVRVFESVPGLAAKPGS